MILELGKKNNNNQKLSELSNWKQCMLRGIARVHLHLRQVCSSVPSENCTWDERSLKQSFTLRLTQHTDWKPTLCMKRSAKPFGHRLRLALILCGKKNKKKKPSFQAVYQKSWHLNIFNIMAGLQKQAASTIFSSVLFRLMWKLHKCEAVACYTTAALFVWGEQVGV